VMAALVANVLAIACHWSSNAFRLEWSMKHYHEYQAGCARKRYAVLRFPFSGLKVVVGIRGYTIDIHTIKRNFYLGNLITSSLGAHPLHTFHHLILVASCCFYVWDS
jgi:hypothetical protein